MKRQQAFTVVELLVVIAIIGVLMALTLPAVQSVRESARKTQCASQLKQIAMGAIAHHTQWEHYPNAGVHWNDGRVKTSQGVPQGFRRQNWGAFYQILPYIEYKSTFDNPVDTEVAAVPVKIYFCPSRRKPVVLPGTQSGMPDGPRGQIDYAGNGGNGPDIFPNQGSFVNQNGVIIPKDEDTLRGGWTQIVDNERVTTTTIKDGTSNTMMFGERNFNRRGNYTNWDENNGYINGWDWDTIRWSYENPAPDRKDTSYYDRRFGSSHPLVMNVAMADGSTRQVSYNISLQIFQQVGRRSDGKAPQLP